LTAPEQKTINAIGIKQATMEQKQVDMADDIQEVKKSIKDLVDGQTKIMELLLSQKNESSEKYVTKRFMTKLVTISMGVASILIAFWHELKR
jgi:negative regulator of replication initiation